mmetsp:Transcript_46511/g.114116  ORF Transcript_46511/g.114116 Transcript_46511/m.114116 type:complete len:139 (-) Transcript_46511:37-453(-)
MSAPRIFSLTIINRDGGCVFLKQFNQEGELTMQLVSVFSILYEMACTISPVAKTSGIQELEGTAFKLQCFQSPTGVKFFFIAERTASSARLAALLRDVYALYADYVLKNPFHTLDQPIRSEKFDRHVLAKLRQAGHVR